MDTNLKKLIAKHNFGKEPKSGLLILAEIIFRDKELFNIIFFYNFSDKELFKNAKESLDNLMKLPKEFSDQLKVVKLLDEKVRIEVEGRNIKIFKNYSSVAVGFVGDEKNIEIIKKILEEIFPDYSTEIIYDKEKETSIAANLYL